VDFHKTYAPTANPESIQLILNSTLDKTIYIKQPVRFLEPGKENHVWLLKKALYSLKQSGQLWYMDLGYKCSKIDPGIFFKIKNGSTKIVAMHVDNSTIVGNSNKTIAEMKVELSSEYQMADLSIIPNSLY